MEYWARFFGICIGTGGAFDAHLPGFPETLARKRLLAVLKFLRAETDRGVLVSSLMDGSLPRHAKNMIEAAICSVEGVALRTCWAST